MKNIFFVTLIGLFLVSCSVQDEVVSPIEEVPTSTTDTLKVTDTLVVEETVIEFDSFSLSYDVCLFSRDSVAMIIESFDSTVNYTILSKNGKLTSVNNDTILCKRGDRILLDVNFDGTPEQTETVDFPWFTVDANFYPAQYGDSAYTHIQVYTFITYKLSSTYTSHMQWGDYYLIRNGIRYNVGTFSVTGNWCNGDCNPNIKIWAKDGDIIALDYNRDGTPEYTETVPDPSHT